MFAFLAIAACYASPRVETQYGPVKGINDVYKGAAVGLFYGIPFASPPVADLRWHRPVPPIPWREVYNATTQRPSCPQNQMGERFFKGDEDCLYLNVVVPEHHMEEALPVMVWIHGGGWETGGKYGSGGKFDARSIATRYKVVVVSGNYRLGPLGWLALPELQGEDIDGSTGNYGLMDQGMVLEWTRDNIKAFGGDPNAVTLFGESAGGFSVCQHMARRASAGLFHRAIMESGSCDSASMLYNDVYNATVLGTEYAKGIGCSQLDPQSRISCLRSLPTQAVLERPSAVLRRNWPYQSLFSRPPRDVPALAPVLPWFATIDYSPAGLEGEPLRLFEDGQGHPVPFLLGFNHEEGKTFEILTALIVRGYFPVLNMDRFMHVLGHFLYIEDNVDRVASFYVSEYPSDNFDTRLGYVLRDRIFACSGRRVARALRARHIPVFMYEWNFPLPEGDEHTTEIPFVFNHHQKTWQGNVMADIVSSYWTSFAKDGHPWSFGAAKWNVYSDGVAGTMNLTLPPSMSSFFSSKACDIWDSIYFSADSAAR